jgi:hypothetical protein
LAASERFFSQGALINTKLRNRLTKATFEKIICLKNWGIFKNEEEQVKKEEKREKEKGEEDINKLNLFYIPDLY